MNDKDGNMIIKCVYCNVELIKIDRPYNIRFNHGFSIQCNNCHAGLLRTLEEYRGKITDRPLTTRMLYDYLVRNKLGDKNDYLANNETRGR